MSDVRLLIADVDWTLLTPEKVLTKRAGAAVRKLRTAGIAFAVISGRQPRGMKMLVGPLELTTPIAAFNGGMLVRPDMSPIEQHTIRSAIVAPVITAMARHGLDVWVHRGGDWLVRDPQAPHVPREQ